MTRVKYILTKEGNCQTRVKRGGMLDTQENDQQSREQSVSACSFAGNIQREHRRTMKQGMKRVAHENTLHGVTQGAPLGPSNVLIGQDSCKTGMCWAALSWLWATGQICCQDVFIPVDCLWYGRTFLTAPVKTRSDSSPCPPWPSTSSWWSWSAPLMCWLTATHNPSSHHDSSKFTPFIYR